MTGVGPSYLRRRVGLQVVAMLAVLVSIMQLLEMLDMTSDILKRGQGLSGVVYYAALRAPAEIVFALPIAVLLGAATTLAAMARGLEITTLRTAGVGLTRLFAWLLPLPIVIGIAQFALADRALPAAENTLKTWWKANAPADEKVKRLWARTEAGPVSIDSASPDGRLLRGLRVYGRDSAGRIESRLEARTARWSGSDWRLENVSELRITGGGIAVGHVDSRAWATNLRPDEVLRLDVQQPRLSTTMLADVIDGGRVGSQSLAWYRTGLWRAFTTPLASLVMLLLALPVAASFARGGSVAGGRSMAVALVLGLAYLLCDGIAAALGSAGSVPPPAAALAAPLVFVILGAVRLRLCERTP